MQIVFIVFDDNYLICLHLGKLFQGFQHYFAISMWQILTNDLALFFDPFGFIFFHFSSDLFVDIRVFFSFIYLNTYKRKKKFY